MNKVIFDSSALLAIINQEEGFEEITEALPYSSMSIVNVTEVISVLSGEGVPEEAVRSIIEEILREIIPFDFDIAFKTGTLINDTFKYGLSLGDRACIATAISLNRPIYTADKAWSDFNLPDNVEIKLFK